MIRSSKASDLSNVLAALSLERFATSLRADFRFAPFNGLLLVVIFILGLAVHLMRRTFSVEAVVICLGSALALVCMLRIAQVWEAVVFLGTADGLITYLTIRPESEVLLTTIVVALLVAPSV